MCTTHHTVSVVKRVSDLLTKVLAKCQDLHLCYFVCQCVDYYSSVQLFLCVAKFLDLDLC